MDGIKSRHVSLRNGSAKEDFLVPGIIPFLEGLKARGVRLYLASGTDEVDVIAEAKLLGVADYFDGGIFGAKDSIKDCSKELVIRQILEENNINGEDLVSFGDGYVEVQLVKEAGGYAIAAATDETRRKGINAWKRERLLSAKADAVIPDFTGAERLIRFLSGEDNAI
jgi:phosphoglycolate phosphatase-like HAD superfamily hydrolase